MIAVGLNSNEKDCRTQVGNTNIITFFDLIRYGIADLLLFSLSLDMELQICYYFRCH